MPPRKGRGKKSAKARQRQQQRQQPSAGAPKMTVRELKEELAELGGDPVRTKKKDLERAVGLARDQFDEATGKSGSECRHGYTPPLLMNWKRIVTVCTEKFVGAGSFGDAVLHSVCSIMAEFPRVLEDSFFWESIKAMAVSLGTSVLLTADDNGYLKGTGCVIHAMLILMAENYNLHGDKLRHQKLGHQNLCLINTVTRKLEHLHQGGRRAAVKFFHQRAHCSCLESVYAEVKSQQDKLGLCYFCKTPTKVRDLWVCTRCNYADYCSKECQVAHWPKHKTSCDLWKKEKFQLVALTKPTKALTPFLHQCVRA